MDYYNDTDYDGVVIKIPSMIYKQNMTALQPMLKNLAEILDNGFSSMHPHIRNSIYEIENVNDKMSRLATIKKYENEKIKKQQQRQKDLLDKKVLIVEWKKDTYWLDLTEFEIQCIKMDEHETIAPKGHIRKKYKNAVKEYVNKNGIKEFLKYVPYVPYVPLYSKDNGTVCRMVDNFIVYKNFGIGFVYEYAYIRDYFLDRNNNFSYITYPLQRKNGNYITSVADLNKYKKDGNKFYLKRDNTNESNI